MIEISHAQLFEAWLVCVVFALLALRLGYTWAIDRMRHVLAVEAFFRACYEATVRRQIREWITDDEGPEFRSLARADRVRGLESRRVA